MYSDGGTSSVVPISQMGFRTNSSVDLKFDAEPIGVIKKIKIFLEGPEPYRCRTIKITSPLGMFNFECTDTIKNCGIGCAQEIEADGGTPYEIAIKTADETGSGTSSIILLSLIGTE